MRDSPVRGHLPRLAPEYYRGFAVVHWVMTVDARATGWLDEMFHARFRESMLHAQSRYQLLCPVYCLIAGSPASDLDGMRGGGRSEIGDDVFTEDYEQIFGAEEMAAGGVRSSAARR